MSSELIEWLARAYDGFCPKNIGNEASTIQSMNISLGSKLFSDDNSSSELSLPQVIKYLCDYFGGSLNESTLSQELVLSEALLVYSVSEDCIWREQCVNIILGMDREVQFELMALIQSGMSNYFTFNNSLNTPLPQSTLDNSATVECRDCAEKESLISNLKHQIELTEAKLLDMEGKLKSSVSTETHKLIDAELQIIEKERLILSISNELSDLKQKTMNFEKKSFEYDKLVAQYASQQDQLEIFQLQAQRFETAELQLEKMRDKLEEYKTVKHQYQQETSAHSETYQKLLEVEAELETMKKYKQQVEEYREQLTEITIELQELRLRLNDREQEFANLQKAYEDVCNQHNVELSERLQLSQDLQATNELLRQNNGKSISLGEGISEFNPVLMQEVTKLRSENIELRSQLEQTSLENLERLTKELADQQSINSSLTKKFMDTKDQLSKALHRIAQLESMYSNLSEEYATYQEQQREISQMVEDDIIALNVRHADAMELQKNHYLSDMSILSTAKDEIISRVSLELSSVQMEFESCKSSLLETLDQKETLENELEDTKSELERINRKRDRENDEYASEIDRIKQESSEKLHLQEEKFCNDLKLQEMKFNSSIESYEERLQQLQADIEEEKVKRRRIEREKRVLDADIHRYKSQAQANTSGGNSENIEIVQKEFKVIQQELENAKAEILLLRSNGSITSIKNHAHSSSDGQSHETVNSTSSVSSRPVRLRVQTQDSMSSSNKGYRNGGSENYSNYIDVAEMNDRKLEVLSKEKRELLAKNLESEKEKAEMNQRLLQSEKDLAAYKSKVTKLTLEKERLERKLIRAQSSDIAE